MDRKSLWCTPLLWMAVFAGMKFVLPASPFAYGIDTFAMNVGMIVWFGYLLIKSPGGEGNKMKKKNVILLICGMLGCLCYGGGDWLMIYGDPTPAGALSWLTAGTAQIPLWRYNLAMALAFPGIVLYGVALFAMAHYIAGEREKKVYCALNAFGLTPWIALHLFYIMILVLHGYLSGSGRAAEASEICEGLFNRLSWVVMVSEAIMLPVFVYWFYLQIAGKTAFPRWFALTNVLVIFALLKGLTLLMPVSAFRLAFTNGLMSESMILWFGAMLVRELNGGAA